MPPRSATSWTVWASAAAASTTRSAASATCSCAPCASTSTAYDRSVQEILDQSPAPARAIIGVFQEAAANGCFIVNAGIELASHDADITRIVTGFYRTAEHRFQMLIEQGQRAGEIAAGMDPLQTAHLLFGLLLGLWVLVRSGASGEPVLRAAVRQVLALVPAHQPGGLEQREPRSAGD